MKYLVVTPTYTQYIDYFPEDACGPTYDGADVIEVEANTKREAISIGVKEMLKGRASPMGFNYCHNQRADKRSPYTGVKAYPMEESSREQYNG